jgi:hypothetical protein
MVLMGHDGQIKSGGAQQSEADKDAGRGDVINNYAQATGRD